ncbi:hypothetical protein FKM82_013600 [Ascaphus truei]
MSSVPAATGDAPGGSRRLQQTQAQVNEVVDIMRVNVDKVLERDQKLSELDDRADALQAGASQFETSAAKLKRKYWWKNCKMWAILIAVILVIIIIIIGEYHVTNTGPASVCRTKMSIGLVGTLAFFLIEHCFWLKYFKLA